MTAWLAVVWAVLLVGYIVAAVINDRAATRLRRAEERRERQIGILLGLQAGRALRRLEVGGEVVYDADREGGETR